MIYFTKGLPGSGKTYKVKQLQKENSNLVLVSKDDIRLTLFGAKYKYSRKKESLVKTIERQVVETLLQNDRDVAIHNTHLAGDHETYYRNLANKYGVEFTVIDCTDEAIENCLVRDYLRANTVGYKVILGMAKKYMPELYEDFKSIWPDDSQLIDALNSMKVPPYNTQLPSCIICDIDGTLALTGNRSPYDGELAYLDKVNWPVAIILKTFSEAGIKVFLFSGRKANYLDVTTKWLKDNRITYDVLSMRKPDDERPDDVVKKEMFNTLIHNHYNCIFIIDDRDRVVQMWRMELNQCVLQANYGNF